MTEHKRKASGAHHGRAASTDKTIRVQVKVAQSTDHERKRSHDGAAGAGLGLEKKGESKHESKHDSKPGSRRNSHDSGAAARPKRPRETGENNFLCQFSAARLSCKPAPKKKKKAAKLGEKTTPDALGLSRLDLAQLWSHYDHNSNGFLDDAEVEELAEDILDRIPSLYGEFLKADNPKLPPNVIAKMVKDDLHTIVPGSVSHVAAYLKKELPFNWPQNRKIREQEFTSRWNGAAQHLFKGVHVDTTSELSCAIL